VVAVRESTGLAGDLESLASSLDALNLANDPSLERERCRLVRTIRSYLMPRLMTPGLPLTVVFAGPTGSGKSTLLNSLAGIEVSETGPVRPTTKEPVVLTSRSNAPSHRQTGGVECYVVEGTAPILDHVSLVDTPDIDSTSKDHRITAETLIDNADVVVFVTSVLRYADAIPWEVLRRAQSREAPLLFVLNRVSSDSAGAHVDFTSRLRGAGLGQSVLRVPEHHLSASDPAVPALAVRELRRKLEAIARDSVRNGRDILDRVLTATISQASVLIEKVDDLSATIELEAEEARGAFEWRLAELDLSGVVQPMSFEEPAVTGGWATRRWLRVNRLTTQAFSAVRMATSEALARTVESDIGHAAAAAGVDPAMVMGAARPVVREALDGWWARLELLVEGVPNRDQPLALAVLAQMVLTGVGREAGKILFGVRRDRVLGEARSSLTERMGVAYSFASGLATSGQGGGDLDTRHVADRLAAVVVRSHFADA
jgi:energy-coupling factor transporter ATP-binding protein EcfA2